MIFTDLHYMIIAVFYGCPALPALQMYERDRVSPEKQNRKNAL